MSKLIGLDCKVYWAENADTPGVFTDGVDPDFDLEDSDFTDLLTEQATVVSVEDDTTIQEVDVSDRTSEIDQFRMVGLNQGKRLMIHMDEEDDFFIALREAVANRTPIGLVFASGSVTPNDGAQFAECDNWAVGGETHSEGRKDAVLCTFTLKPTGQFYNTNTPA